MIALTATQLRGVWAAIPTPMTVQYCTTDYSFVPGALAGASGFYGFWVNTLADWRVAQWRLDAFWRDQAADRLRPHDDRPGGHRG